MRFKSSGFAIILLVCLLLTGVAATVNGEDITLQQGVDQYEGSADSWMQSNRVEDNHGKDKILNVQANRRAG